MALQLDLPFGYSLEGFLAVAISGLAHRKLYWFILKEFSTNNRSGFAGGLHHHCPGQARLLDDLLALENFLQRPGLTSGDMVQRCDDAPGARLDNVLKADRVSGAKPAPCFLHSM